MHIQITPENLLIQLAYPVKEATLQQVERIINNTDGFDKFARHILSLEDEIKRFGGIVALSNSKDYLKVKTDSKNPEEIEAFTEYIKHWAEKYKITLEKVESKNTFYILGQK